VDAFLDRQQGAHALALLKGALEPEDFKKEAWAMRMAKALLHQVSPRFCMRHQDIVWIVCSATRLCRLYIAPRHSATRLHLLKDG
jgi:phosphopantetheine adenylyltransferase